MIDEKTVRAELQNIQKYFEAKMDMTIGDGKLKMACWARTCRDALELLEAQQPVKPHRNYQYLSDYWCACGWHLGKAGSVKYCPECGRKVKWDV